MHNWRRTMQAVAELPLKVTLILNSIPLLLTDAWLPDGTPSRTCMPLGWLMPMLKRNAMLCR